MEESWFERLKSSIIITGLSFFTAYGYVYYTAKIGFQKAITEKYPFITSDHLIFLQMIPLLLILFICSSSGFFLGHRYKLPIIGNLSQIRKNIFIIIIPSFILLLLSYLLTLTVVKEISIYPNSLFWALIFLLYGFTEEVIGRFGLMTIGYGVFKNMNLSNITVSIYLTLMTILKSYPLIEFNLENNSKFLIFYALLFFISSLLYGYLFGKFGLIASTLSHFIVGLKYIIISSNLF